MLVALLAVRVLLLSAKHLFFAATTNESGIPRSGSGPLSAPSPRSPARSCGRPPEISPNLIELREIASPSRHSTARYELSAIVYRQTPIHRQDVVDSSNGSRYPRSVRPTGCIGRDNKIGSQSSCLLTLAHRTRPVEENGLTNCPQLCSCPPKICTLPPRPMRAASPRSWPGSLSQRGPLVHFFVRTGLG